MICCSVNRPFSDTQLKRLREVFCFVIKIIFISVFCGKKKQFSGKMPLKCSNNAQCFCLTKNATIMYKSLVGRSEAVLFAPSLHNMSGSTRGETYLPGHLRAMGYTAQRRRINESLNRVDPGTKVWGGVL